MKSVRISVILLILVLGFSLTESLLVTMHLKKMYHSASLLPSDPHIYEVDNEDKPYEFTLTNEDMERGQVIFYDSSLSIAKVKVHENYFINLYGTNLTPDANGIINFPYRKDLSEVELCLSNGIRELCLYSEVQENQRER